MYCLASLLLVLAGTSGVSVDPDMQTDALQDAPLRAEEGDAMFVFPSMQMARSSMVSYSSCRTGLRAVWAGVHQSSRASDWGKPQPVFHLCSHFPVVRREKPIYDLQKELNFRPSQYVWSSGPDQTKKISKTRKKQMFNTWSILSRINYCVMTHSTEHPVATTSLASVPGP